MVTWEQQVGYFSENARMRYLEIVGKTIGDDAVVL